MAERFSFTLRSLVPLVLAPLHTVGEVQRLEELFNFLSTTKSHWIDRIYTSVTANRIATLTNDISRRPPNSPCLLHERFPLPVCCMPATKMHCDRHARPPSCHTLSHVHVLFFRELFSLPHSFKDDSKSVAFFSTFHAERPSCSF